MASPVPAKSQPLHNFSLPQLKWNKNHTNNLHRSRRHTDSPPQQPLRSPLLYSSPKQSPMDESVYESEYGFVSDRHKDSAPEVIKSSVSVSSSTNLTEKSEKEGTSKIYIRLRKNKVTESVEDDQVSLAIKDENNEEKVNTDENHDVGDYVEPKTWNLRPRKPLRKRSTTNNGGTIGIPETRSQLTQVRPQHDADTEVKKDKKQKFSIALSREEIEEDIFKMNGSKPSRKPKKRAKSVQKQLDNLFPGMWLSSITPDCYKVPEAPLKG